MDNKTGIKWIKNSNSKGPLLWEPVYIMRSSSPNRKDCAYYIGKSSDGKYRTYHADDLHNSPNTNCSTIQLQNAMTKSLQKLFSKNMINEKEKFPMYLYQKTPASKSSLLSPFNIFGSNADDEKLTLQPVIECEFHESSNIDKYDREITGVWIKTNQKDEKVYKSMDKIKTIHYIDDVNPVQYIKSNENDWILIGNDHDDESSDFKTQSTDDLNAEIKELKLQRSNSMEYIKDLKTQNQRLSNQLQQNESNKENDALIAQHKKNLDEKQREIDQLRRELIARSNAKELNSTFPTVEEVCTDYRSIKNQEFQSVHGRITKPLRKKHKEWNKYYVNKLSHRLLFETLILCYEHTLAYHDRIYCQIGDILQISYDDDANALEFLFHRYLTSNFEIMRQSKDFVQMKEEKIMNECMVKYKENIFDILDEEERNLLVDALRVFVAKCCEISWSMILQRPRLSISPNVFMPNTKVGFDENKHTRVLGSSKRDKCVLYYVWPGIAQNNVQLDNVKVYVVQRDKDFPQTK